MATNTEIIKDAYASFAAGDVPGALSAFADDILWVEPDGYPIIGGTYVGPQAVVEGVFMRLAEIGDEFAVVPEQFVAEGDTVVALGHLAWKHKDTGAPAVVKTVFEQVRLINQQDVTIVMVEQNVRSAFNLSTRGIVLDRGQVTLEGKPEDLLDDPHVKSLYLGE